MSNSSHVTNLPEDLNRETCADLKRKMLSSDITRIKDVLESDDKQLMCELHMELDSKYNPYVPNWGYNLYQHGKLGSNPQLLSTSELVSNLRNMMAKLSAYYAGFTTSDGIANNRTQTTNIDLSLNNNANVNLNTTFEEAKTRIEDITTGLNQGDVDIILQKLEELQYIQQKNDSRRKKWEKIKPILQFALDKGIDVATIFLQMFLQASP